MEVSFQGYGEQIVTFEATEDVKKGNLVKMSANGQVAPCAAGDLFCGVAVGVREGLASVQLAGYITVGNADISAVGYQKMAAASATQIKAVASASGGTSGNTAASREILVLDVDTSAGTAGILL